MATNGEHDLSKRIEERLRELNIEDDFAGTLNVLDRYPRLETRGLSEFERDLREWGMTYGIAFGLAMSMCPEMAHPAAAEAAYSPAYHVFTRWSGEIEDPGVKRETAIRNILRGFGEVERKAFSNGGRYEMTDELASSIQKLGESARG